MAPRNKLLLRDDAGMAMVQRVVQACRASSACETLVVTGHQAEAIRQAASASADGGPVRFVFCPDHDAGLSASLRTGIVSLPPATDAVLVCLADMPRISAALIDRIIAASAPGSIVVPTCRGAFGNPVIWDRAFFAELLALSGDRGGRGLLGRHAALIRTLDVGDDAVLADVDTPEAAADDRWR
jgi:molybdenum cofactor cytidylyltransferase